jgi:hypothetical protein
MWRARTARRPQARGGHARSRTATLWCCGGNQSVLDDNKKPTLAPSVRGGLWGGGMTWHAPPPNQPHTSRAALDCRQVGCAKKGHHQARCDEAPPCWHVSQPPSAARPALGPSRARGGHCSSCQEPPLGGLPLKRLPPRWGRRGPRGAAGPCQAPAPRAQAPAWPSSPVPGSSSSRWKRAGSRQRGTRTQKACPAHASPRARARARRHT